MLRDLQQEDSDAVRQLYERYWPRLVALARNNLRAAGRRESDEEDVAQSVLVALCRGAKAGRLPDQMDPQDLWRLLITITRGKVTDRLRRNAAAVRGGGQVRGDSALVQPTASGRQPGFDGLEGDDLPADFQAVLDEEAARLLALLPADDLRQVALLRLEGYSNDEISRRLSIALRSVERKAGHVGSHYWNLVHSLSRPWDAEMRRRRPPWVCTPGRGPD